MWFVIAGQNTIVEGLEKTSKTHHAVLAIEETTQIITYQYSLLIAARKISKERDNLRILGQLQT